MGKYSHITAKLPKILGTEGPYQLKVDEVKDHILNARPLAPHEEEKLYDDVKTAIEKMVEAANVVEGALLALSGGRRHGTVFARMYKTIRDAKTAHEDNVESRINLLQIALEQLLIDQFENEGTYQLKLEGGGTVRIQDEPHAQVKDREAFRRWCLSEKLDSQMTLPWQTTNAILKERLLSGLDVMPGVEAYSKSKAVYSKK